MNNDECVAALVSTYVVQSLDMSPAECLSILLDWMDACMMSGDLKFA